MINLYRGGYQVLHIRMSGESRDGKEHFQEAGIWQIMPRRVLECSGGKAKRL